jgi:hypothetical protein
MIILLLLLLRLRSVIIIIDNKIFPPCEKVLLYRVKESVFQNTLLYYRCFHSGVILLCCLLPTSHGGDG